MDLIFIFLQTETWTILLFWLLCILFWSKVSVTNFFICLGIEMPRHAGQLHVHILRYIFEFKVQTHIDRCIKQLYNFKVLAFRCLQITNRTIIVKHMKDLQLT